MATHSRILACRIPWTEEPGRLQSLGLQRVRHDRATNAFFLNCVYWLHCTLFTYFTIMVSGIQQHKSVIITNNYTYMASLLSLPPFLPHPTRLGHQRAPPGLPVLHCGFPKASVLTHGSVYTSVLLSQLTPRSQLTPPSPEPGDLPGGSDGKASAYSEADLGSIPGSGRSSGEGNGNPLQYSCLGHPMDGGAW